MSSIVLNGANYMAAATAEGFEPSVHTETGCMAATIEVEALPGLREQLLKSVNEGARLYREVIKGINDGRPEADWIPVHYPSEYREMAEDWLTSGRLAAAATLPQSSRAPLIVFPRLHLPITREEIVQCWFNAGDREPRQRLGLMRFLSNWTEDELSGYAPGLAGEVSFLIVPSAYDFNNEGTSEAQLDALRNAQQIHSNLDIASLFEGACLARRLKDGPREIEDSIVRVVNLKPGKNEGPDAVPVAFINDLGSAEIFNSSSDRFIGMLAARRIVK